MAILRNEITMLLFSSFYKQSVHKKIADADFSLRKAAYLCAANGTILPQY